jgi:AcrR family transcriptional regulator
MTVYHQFKSRVGLLEALFDDLARRGGLVTLPAVFTKEDPAEALAAFVRVFCRFWQSERIVLRRVRAAAALDPGLERALAARDERRRQGLRVIVDRLNKGNTMTPGDVTDTVDLLHALTSFDTYDMLARTRRAAEVEAVIVTGARAVLGLDPQTARVRRSARAADDEHHK